MVSTPMTTIYLETSEIFSTTCEPTNPASPIISVLLVSIAFLPVFRSDTGTTIGMVIEHVLRKRC